jgi:molybdopterin-guanine dinucleotide biosynthesis protein MobB
MRIVAFVGLSGGGKTRLVVRLVEEFSRRGLKTAVIKHCSHGFEPDPEAKDSRKFWEAGAEGVALLSPRQWAVRKRIPPGMSVAHVVEKMFADQDIILVEGGKHERGIRKIAVQQSGAEERLTLDPAELAAVVSEEELPTERPVFHPDQIPAIADFILEEEGP